jgi:hypothetical protein
MRVLRDDDVARLPGLGQGDVAGLRFTVANPRPPHRLLPRLGFGTGPNGEHACGRDNKRDEASLNGTLHQGSSFSAQVTVQNRFVAH